ncbi:MAG TPA: hypothetical protein VKG26_07230, partial [Bacteroidia bacterium]|nr:hypothetical protein [Bacteroidia bacterium]
TTGVVSISGENTIITFNSSGTFTVLAPVVTVSPATATVCAGNHVVLTASGVSTYSWSPSSGLSSTSGISVIATPTATTTYTVSGTNSYGTVSSATVTVNVNATPAITISPALPVVAGGQSATITASGASTYTWSPSTNLNTTSGATVTANPQIATAYTLTGTSSAGCVNQLAFSVGIELFQQTADSANAPIYYNGKLGIGNNNPQAALDVTGNTKVSGLLTSNTIKVSSFSGLSSGAFVTVDSLGNLKVNPNNNNPVTLCGTTTPWMIGGNTIGNSGAVLGTCDAKDLILKANATNFLWLKSNGKVGIGTNSPSAQLDVSAYGTYAGLNIGNSSGSWFNVANNGKIGIGNTSPAAQLDIYAPGSNTGVTISNDNGPVFNIANDGSTSTNGSLTVSNGALIYGNVTIPSIINTATGVIYSSVLVDNTGKLVSGPAASATGAAWILSGNTGTYASGISQAMGALDNQADLPLLAGGTEKLRIWSNGGLNLSNTGVIQCGGTSPITSISDMGLYSQRSGYDMRFVTNNGNFNFYTNIADGTNPLGTPAVSISSTGQTIINASAGGDALILNDVSSNSSSPGNNFKVKSNGVVCAREVIVRAIGNSFPDYVFTKGYKLMPLSEVSSFIEKNHRLPNMPSAAEIEKDGASLGEIQRVSVEKIEELTLYMIELKQEIEKLKQENKDLKAIINKN